MKFTELETNRKLYQNKFITKLILGILLLLVGNLSFIFFIFYNNVFLIIFLSLFIIFSNIYGIYLIYISYKHLKQFKTNLKNDLVDEILSTRFKEYTYDPNKHISLKEINEVGIIQKPSTINGEDYLTFKYKENTVSLSDVRLVVSAGKHSYVSFQGKWITIEFNKSINGTVKVVQGSKLYINKKGLTEFETESTVFNTKFNSYGTNDKVFFKTLRFQTIDSIINIEKEHKGKTSLAFIDNKIHIALNDKSDFLKVNINKQINKSILKDFEHDIDNLVNFIDSTIDTLLNNL